MTKPLDDSRVDQLIADYLADSLSEADRIVFENWLRASPANPRRAARLSATDYAIREVCQDTKADYLLDVLNQIDQAAGPAQLVTLHHIDAGWHRYRLPVALGGAMAAVLLIAVTLIITLQGPTPEPSPYSDALTPNMPAASTPSTPRGSDLSKPIVATLTATHNAQWASPQAEGASAPVSPGSPLYPGDRLTLTAGFAEITTGRGAIAILEAPCVVEMTDNDNALRLHTGKLVGICETDSSKGFLVHTPHMNVIDLGTRFGVDASQADATEVHVFAGEVQAGRVGIEPMLLGADQSARASADTSAIATIAHDTERFAAIRDESRLGPPRSSTVLDTDTSGTQWLITTSHYAGSETYLGNQVTCSVDNTGFRRGVVGGNAYGFIQHEAGGAGSGQAATATGSWTFSNLPAGRYDVATAFSPTGAGAVRYTINGVEVLVDQSAIPASDAGPSFSDGIGGYNARDDDIQFTLIGSSIVVPEGGTITVTIDNSNNPTNRPANMDSVAITLVPEAGRN